jgi:DNA modification methylase
MAKAIDQRITDEYAIYNGDCVELIKNVPDNTIGLCVFSPPFPGMYAYTDSSRDMGNCKNSEEMLAHFKFLLPGLFRAMMPGRSTCIHLTQEPVFKWQEGESGLRDFRGMVIAAMQEAGFVFASERMIDKDPQLKAARTKDSGLAMQTAAKDASRLTGTMADYLLQFRKPGENPVPIRALTNHDKPELQNKDGWITKQEWIWWASCVWWNSKRHTPDGGISETDVLRNFVDGRENDDEKHLCPLQLGVIERCVKLWSAPGDTVLSPFAGIGSEGYVSIKLRRKFIGFELKPSYFRVACRNLDDAVRVRNEADMPLFSGVNQSNEVA